MARTALPLLMFDRHAEGPTSFYVCVFRNSRIRI